MARMDAPRPWRVAGLTLNGLALVFLAIWLATDRVKWPAIVAAVLLLAAVACYLAELFTHAAARR
jgi:hypothetical protein